MFILDEILQLENFPTAGYSFFSRSLFVGTDGEWVILQVNTLLCQGQFKIYAEGSAGK